MTKEEAIRRIKAWNLDSDDMEVLSVVIPELVESEDEKIRKIIRLALIASEDELSDFYKVHNISRKECTDWLEKQKEQKPVNNEKEFESIDNSFRRGREVGFSEGVESAKQSAEWSEEDEKMVRFYEADYNNQIGDMSMKDVIDMRLKFKDWLVNRLKYLRPQPHTVSIKDITKFGNLEYERGVKDGLNHH